MSVKRKRSATAKTKAKRPRVSMSHRALLARINRKLRHEGKKGRVLKTARSARAQLDVGYYFIVDLADNSIHSHDVDLEDVARELGVLEPWEQLEEEQQRELVTGNITNLLRRAKRVDKLEREAALAKAKRPKR